ncbi:DUF4272 domain-containing protein [Cerasicoccus frondis]|uniref:DUF4272 domain-containing protein n=1 Tax=Cerasicoccus frondis TaxID=490090 RepID=UPI0028524B1A|nr:DUF4272 domain-containing protein [Cerasicoccus frondis]
MMRIFISFFAIQMAATLAWSVEPTGPVYAEPHATKSIEELGGDPTTHNTEQPDPLGAALRAHSNHALEEAGFRCAPSLPTLGHRAGVPGKLRPEGDIEKRLLVNYVLYLYVVFGEDDISKDDLGAFMSVYNLPDEFTQEEAVILTTPRSEARKQYMDSIGWKLENMAALAWLLGYDVKPSLDGKMIHGDAIGALLEFTGGAWEGPEAFRKALKLRSEAEVQQLEDTFYCAHNAVRSAQMGYADQAPKGFHPVMNGGVIHEKRHVLTWALSPGTPWDETDLST